LPPSALLRSGITGILQLIPKFARAAKNDQGRAHTMKTGRIGVAVAAWLMLLAVSGSGWAQENFPNRPVRIVIPYSPGSVADVFARIVGQNMATQWNGSIVVESKSGANGSIAAEEVARSAPDGYTWLLVTVFFTASPALDAKLRWDPVRDFIPVGADLPGAELLHRAFDVARQKRRGVCGAGEGKTGHAELQPSRQGLDGASRL
jgi:hypothetical protein